MPPLHLASARQERGTLSLLLLAHAPCTDIALPLALPDRLPWCRLGIYSSATRPTITKALGKLQNNLANFLEQRRQRAQRAQQAQQDAEHAQQREQQQRGQPAAVAGASPGAGGKRKRASGQAEAAAAPAAAAGAAVDVFPAALPLPELFEIVMARDHCQPASRVLPPASSLLLLLLKLGHTAGPHTWAHTTGPHSWAHNLACWSHPPPPRSRAHKHLLPLSACRSRLRLEGGASGTPSSP